MKKIFKPQHILVALISLFCLIFLLPGPAISKEPLRIAVLPFEINAQQNLDFLKEGIQDMLNSRLSWKDEVKVIDKKIVKQVAKTAGEKGFTGESHALLAGGELQADFVIHGSITVIGNSTSIDSKLIDIAGKHQPISFFRQTNDLGGVIPAINEFATTINETIFQRGMATAASGSSMGNRSAVSTDTRQQQATGSAASSIPPAQSQQNQKQGKLNSQFVVPSNRTQNQQNTSAPNPDFTSTANTMQGRTNLWKSKPFNHVINGVEIADINSDNILETVIISDHSVFIYQFSNNRFVKIAEAAKSRLSTFIGVDIADINKNGIPEIFITSLTPEKNGVNSFVLEYDGRGYSKLVKKTPWYFRTVNSKLHGKILLGQKQKRASKGIYSSPIYTMKWNGSQYKPEDKILEPGKANVLGTILDDITGGSSSGLIAYNRSDHLTLLNSTGKVVWKDISSSGGTINRFVLPKETPTDTNPIQFFPLRIRSLDIDGDGTLEIFHASNHDVTLGVLSKIKSLDKGFITCSSWNSAMFMPNWTTPPQSGRVSDFVIDDIDNDGLKELVISTVSKEGSTAFTTAESSITVYELMD